MHVAHHAVHIHVAENHATRLVLRDDEDQVHRNRNHLQVLFPLLLQGVHHGVDHLVLDEVAAVEVGAHAVDDLLQVAVLVHVVHELVPIEIVQHDVPNHVDDALSADRVRRVDVRNQFRDQLSVLVHHKVTTLVQLNVTATDEPHSCHVVQNGSDILIRVGFFILYGSAKEPENQAAEVESLHFTSGRICQPSSFPASGGVARWRPLQCRSIHVTRFRIEYSAHVGDEHQIQIHERVVFALQLREGR